MQETKKYAKRVYEITWQSCQRRVRCTPAWSEMLQSLSEKRRDSLVRAMARCLSHSSSKLWNRLAP